MLRKLLRRSTAAARLAQPQAQATGIARCSLVHTSACEQVADVAAASPADSDKRDSRSLLSARSRVGEREAAPAPPSGAARAASPALPSLVKPGGGALGATAKDFEAATQTLRSLAAKVQASSPRVEGESEYQKHKRLQKAMTGPLDKLLYGLRQRKQFAQIEAIAFVWEDVFPQLASNRKHRAIICENYAHGLNLKQRFEDVVDRFFTKQLAVDANGGVTANPKTLILSPRLAESIWLACGHLADSASALRLLDVMRANSVRITNVGYFHLLNALLKDEAKLELGTVLQLCEELVFEHKSAVAMSLLPTVIKLAAESDELDRAMRVYQHPPDTPMDSFTEFRFEICLQTLCDHGYVSAMLEVYEHVMASTTATRGLKERVSKCLLLRCLRERKAEHNDTVAEVALSLLATMETHHIASNHHCVFPLLRTLLQTGRVKSIGDLTAFLGAHSHVIEWNSFSVCEAVIACVYCKEVQMVDELFVHALDNSIPIKYAALERVISFYYKLGMLGDLKKVADIIRALRLNKHIPLGIAVTEIGMASNLRLGRFQEVIHLFEDFSTMDGERKRILTRRLMLKSALKAYAALNRLDESNAIRALLRGSYDNFLERPANPRRSAEDGGAEDSGAEDDEHGDFFAEPIQKIDR